MSAAALLLEGATLGERHRSFNRLVEQMCTAEDAEGGGGAEGVGDATSRVEALLRVAVAGRRRDLAAVLAALTSRDAAVAAAAVARAPWLLEPAHAHIFNPDALHADLLPRMTARAAARLMLHIRCTLRDPQRVQLFYRFYEPRDLRTALKWLPNCPLPLIEEAVAKHHKHIKPDLFKRLCERSVSAFVAFFDVIKTSYFPYEPYMEVSKFLLNTNPAEYLDVFERNNPHYRRSKLGPKHTKIIMSLYKDRVLNKFETYCRSIDLTTFVEFFDKDDVQSFLEEKIKDENFSSLFNLDNLKPFLKHMSKEEKYLFLKDHYKGVNTNKRIKVSKKLCAKRRKKDSVIEVRKCSSKPPSRAVPMSSSASYQIYRHAPFEVAFTELKKLVRSETAVEERTAMLSVAAVSAGRNPHHIYSLLHYYYDKHLNEPFKYKLYFVNCILSKRDAFKYDDNTWNLLNTIFKSLEVFVESDANVTSCVEYVLIYKLLRGEDIPDIILKKFQFNTMKKYHSRLNTEEQEVIFKFLYEDQETKLMQLDLAKKEEFNDATKLLCSVLNLLADWKKSLAVFELVIKKMKEVILIANTNSWSINNLYSSHVKKPWKKYFFDVSLLVVPTEETCLNVLKHKPSLLKVHESAVDSLRYNDAANIHRFLSKLRMYWEDSIAQDWIEQYRSRLDQDTGHKAAVRGLFTLLHADKAAEIINAYAPVDPKINWNEADQKLINIQKAIATTIYLIQPTVTPEVVMPFLKGDYVQFGIRSLISIFAGMSPDDCRKQIVYLLNTPVSIQKHGIRLAFSKLSSEELREMFSNLWMSNKNSSIRTIIFKLTYDFMCKQKNPSDVRKMWNLLQIFIENLTDEESKAIYSKLTEIRKIPAEIKAEFVVKSYQFFKSASPKVNTAPIINKLHEIVRSMVNSVDKLDPHFVENLILDHIKEAWIDKGIVQMKILPSAGDMLEIIAAFMIFSTSPEVRKQRTDTIFLPLLQQIIEKWDLTREYLGNKVYVSREYFEQMLKKFTYILRNAFDKINLKEVVAVFSDVLTVMEKHLRGPEYFLLCRWWQLSILCLQSFVCVVNDIELHGTSEDKSTVSDSDNDYDIESSTNDARYEQICAQAIPQFAQTCCDEFEKDLEKYYPSIRALFSRALRKVLSNFQCSIKMWVILLKKMLELSQNESVYLMVLDVLHGSYSGSDYKDTLAEINVLYMSHPSDEVKMHYCNSRFFKLFSWD